MIQSYIKSLFIISTTFLLISSCSHPDKPKAEFSEECQVNLMKWKKNLKKVTNKIHKYEKTLDLKQPSNDITTLLKMAKKIDKESYYGKLKQINKAIAGSSISFPYHQKKILKIKQNRPDGDYNKEFDYSRASLIVPYKDTLIALKLIKKTFGKKNVIYINNRILKPSEIGYRDIRLLVRDSKTKHISELLIISPDMNKIKHGQGYRIYKESKEIINYAENENRLLSRQEEKIIKEYKEESRAIYNITHNNELKRLCLNLK